MYAKITLLALSLASLAFALPTAPGVAEKRDPEEGIYSYYPVDAVPDVAENDKREAAVYPAYYTGPAGAKEEKREEGIYTYYGTIPEEAKKDKREAAVYPAYYTGPAGVKEDKREEGIYTYYTIPVEAEKEKREPAPQDFEDQVSRS